MTTTDARRAHDAWLDQIVGLPEGAALRKISVDTLRREGRRGRIKILWLSARRRGITRREALRGLPPIPPKNT